ncbi:hypothetical protein BC936DRAFT_144011 [Jimgerdemannia flammicorona]|uniref:Uncharacterized protein n=1 Tax=Jimgerdemannia flammicorona TaxID=994334 RepID=A0A433DD79_9FUNG|nr:hypothetical protein BC936DRAFT_144011 [Jimgerdemannia flammicorona]
MPRFEYKPQDQEMNDRIRATIAKRLRTNHADPQSRTAAPPSLTPPASSSRRYPSDSSSAADQYSANDSDNTPSPRRSRRRKTKVDPAFDPSAHSSGLPSPPAESPVHRPTPIHDPVLDADIRPLSVPLVTVSDTREASAGETTPRSSPKMAAAALPLSAVSRADDPLDTATVSISDVGSVSRTIPTPEPSTSALSGRANDAQPGAAATSGADPEVLLTEEEILEQLEKLKTEKHELFLLFRRLTSEASKGKDKDIKEAADSKDKDIKEAVEPKDKDRDFADAREKEKLKETKDKESLPTAGQSSEVLVGRDWAEGVTREKVVGVAESSSSNHITISSTNRAPTTTATTTTKPQDTFATTTSPSYRTTSPASRPVQPSPVVSKPITSPFANQIPATAPPSSSSASNKRPRSTSPPPPSGPSKSLKFGEGFNRGGMYFMPARPFGPADPVVPTSPTLARISRATTQIARRRPNPTIDSPLAMLHPLPHRRAPLPRDRRPQGYRRGHKGLRSEGPGTDRGGYVVVCGLAGATGVSWVVCRRACRPRSPSLYLIFVSRQRG